MCCRQHVFIVLFSSVIAWSSWGPLHGRCSERLQSNEQHTSCHELPRRAGVIARFLLYTGLASPLVMPWRLHRGVVMMLLSTGWAFWLGKCMHAIKMRIGCVVIPSSGETLLASQVGRAQTA
jgi:hypothetical protein